MQIVEEVLSKPVEPWWNARIITTVTLGRDYVHETKLKDFLAKHRKDFHYVNEYVRDNVFTRVSDKLIAGRTYEIRSINIQRGETPYITGCLRMLTRNNALLTGPQGLTLLWEHAKERMVPDMNYIALDRLEGRPRAHDGRRGCAFIQRGKTRKLRGEFSIGIFQELHSFDCLVYFKEIFAGGAGDGGSG